MQVFFIGDARIDKKNNHTRKMCMCVYYKIIIYIYICTCVCVCVYLCVYIYICVCVCNDTYTTLDRKTIVTGMH